MQTCAKILKKAFTCRFAVFVDEYVYMGVEQSNKSCVNLRVH